MRKRKKKLKKKLGEKREIKIASYSAFLRQKFFSMYQKFACENEAINRKEQIIFSLIIIDERKPF